MAERLSNDENAKKPQNSSRTRSFVRGHGLTKPAFRLFNARGSRGSSRKKKREKVGGEEDEIRSSFEFFNESGWKETTANDKKRKEGIDTKGTILRSDALLATISAPYLTYRLFRNYRSVGNITDVYEKNERKLPRNLFPFWHFAFDRYRSLWFVLGRPKSFFRFIRK